MKNNLKKHIPFIITYFVIIILLFLQHNVVHMYFDDFGNASLSYATTVENVIKTNYTFKQLIDEAIFTYFNFGGRILYGMIVTLLLKGGIKPFMITQVFVIMGIFYMISSIVTKITKKNSIIYPIICMILYMLFDISILRHGIYWASASILYLWPLLPFLALINYYLKNMELIKSGKKVNYIKYILINIPLIIFTVFSQEQIGIGLIAFFIIYILFDHIKNIKKYLKYDLFTVLLSIITYLVLFLAPGNWARMDMNNGDFAKLSFFEKIKTNYPKIMNVLFQYRTNTYMNVIAIVVLIFLVYYFIKKYKTSKLYYLLLLPIGGLILNFIVYDKEYYYRPKLFLLTSTITLLSIFVGLVVYYVDKKKLKYMAFPISAAASIFCMLMAPYIIQRTSIPCIIILFVPIISIGYDLFKSNRTIKVLLIIILAFCAYRGLDNYAHVYLGYKRNYNTVDKNYKKLEHYKKYEKDNTIILCKVKDIQYGSEQSYVVNYDYWLEQYFDLPEDLKLEWNDCSEKN